MLEILDKCKNIVYDCHKGRNKCFSRGFSKNLNKKHICNRNPQIFAAGRAARPYRAACLPRALPPLPGTADRFFICVHAAGLAAPPFKSEGIKHAYINRTQERGKIQQARQGFFMIFLFTTEENAILSKIFRDHYSLMNYMAYKITDDRFAADDMVQDTMIKLMDYLPTLLKLNKNELASYCARTVETVSITYMRKEISKKKRQGTQDSRVPAIMPEELIEQDDIRRAVNTMLTKLSPLDRHLLIYKYFMGYRYKQIGKLLGIEPKYIGTYLQRARDRAKRLLGGKGDYL